MTKTIVILSLLVLLALFFRAAHLSFGLPYVVKADEMTNFNVLQGMIERGDGNPRFFRYPSLFFYLNVPAQLLLERLSGDIVPITVQSLGTGHTETPIAVLIARATTLTFGVLIIPLLWIWAVAIEKKLVLAASACLLTSMGPLLIEHSTYLTPDIAASFFVTGALFATTMILNTKSLSWYIAAGVVAGLAASTKYNAGLVAISILVAHFQIFGINAKRISFLLAFGAAAFATLLITSPFLVLDFNAALSGFLFEVRHYQNGHVGAEGRAALVNAKWIFAQTGISILFLIGCCLSPKLARLFPTLVFLVLYYLLISAQNVRFERNIIPMLPAIYLLIAFGLYSFFQKFFEISLDSDGFRNVALAAILIIGFNGPLLQTKHNFANFVRDPRETARQWLEQSIPNDASVALDAYSPFLTEQNRKIYTSNFILNENVDWFDGKMFVVITVAGSGRFLDDKASRQSKVYNELVARACDIQEFPDLPRRSLYTLLRVGC